MGGDAGRGYRGLHPHRTPPPTPPPPGRRAAGNHLLLWVGTQSLNPFSSSRPPARARAQHVPGVGMLPPRDFVDCVPNLMRQVHTHIDRERERERDNKQHTIGVMTEKEMMRQSLSSLASAAFTANEFFLSLPCSSSTGSLNSNAVVTVRSSPPVVFGNSAAELWVADKRRRETELSAATRRSVHKLPTLWLFAEQRDWRS